MRVNTTIFQRDRPLLCTSGRNPLGSLAAYFLLLLLAFEEASAEMEWPHIALSKDGTPISYEIFGKGEPTLVFVHGWSCDARYWRAQVPVFSKKHRVVVLDLAGHGHSGMSRTRYTMGSFGEDVLAVTGSTGSQNVILIGHSMGGPVIAEAARLMPDRVIGLIGVDTLENIEYPMTPEELEKMTQYITGEAATVFDKIKIPVVTVNGDLWSVNYEANRRHMLSFDAIVLKGADHFLMLDRPDEFNKALEQSILMLKKKMIGDSGQNYSAHGHRVGGVDAASSLAPWMMVSGKFPKEEN